MKYSCHLSMVHFMSVILNTWIIQETFYASQEEKIWRDVEEKA